MRGQFQSSRCLLLVSMCSALWLLQAAAGDDVGTRRGTSIEKIYADQKGQIHIVSNGADVLAPMEKDQALCDHPKLADDGETAGWLVNYKSPVSLSLIIYRRTKAIRRFHPPQDIFDWQFLETGKRVAFWTGPLHGDFVPHFALHDIASGRLLAEWDGHIDDDSQPDWVSGLKE